MALSVGRVHSFCSQPEKAMPCDALHCQLFVHIFFNREINSNVLMCRMSEAQHPAKVMYSRCC